MFLRRARKKEDLAPPVLDPEPDPQSESDPEPEPQSEPELVGMFFSFANMICLISLFRNFQ
jgi:hypothetical protein